MMHRRPAHALLAFAAPVLLALASAPAPASGQLLQPAGSAIPGEPVELQDRIAAVVGDSIILVSQIQEEMLLLEQGGQANFPTDPAGRRAAMAQVLETLINLQLILQEAARDSTLLPDPGLIDERVDQQLAAVREQFPSVVQFEAALASDGMTMSSYRDALRTRIERELVQQLFLERRLRDAPPVVIAEEELRSIYEDQKTQLQQRPEILSLEQVLLRPSPPDAAFEAARAKADSLLERVRAGEDFAALARQYSDDPGSGANGGDLGWFRRGNMVREFEDVAFRLGDGQVSDLVRSEFGWHIIRVDRSRPGEVKARHILVRPEGGNDLDDTLRRAGEFAELLRAGASADSLHEAVGITELPSSLQVPREQLSQLPPGYDEALVGAAEGIVLEPFAINLGAQTLVAVVKVSEIREAGEFTFEDLRDQIRSRLQQQRRIDRLWDQLRAEAYVDIRFLAEPPAQGG